MEWEIYVPADCGTYQDEPTFKVTAVNIGELIEAVSSKLAERNMTVAGYLRVKNAATSFTLAFIDQIAAIARDLTNPRHPVQRIRCPLH